MSTPFISDPYELVEAVADGKVKIASADDVRDLMSQVGRNSAPGLLLGFYDNGDVEDQWMPQLVCDAWTDAEFPMGQLEPDDWRWLWHACGGYVLNGVRAPHRRPRKPRRLYRGADEAHRDGWSWTPNPTVAAWFANRFPELRAEQGTPGRVWTALVPPAAMLAAITSRRASEPEVVVDTLGLLIEPAEQSKPVQP